jgi:hypothetical protein
MRHIVLIGPIAALAVSCTTLSQSLELGAPTGALTGAAATYLAQTSSHSPASSENIALGASIGLGVGLLASYLIHDSVAQDRKDLNQQTEMQFGDLPPSPFVFPKPPLKKGAH